MKRKPHAHPWIAGIATVLYQKWGQRILRVILQRNGGDMAVAEQVLQDTFVAALKSFHTFEHKSSYFTWLCKIALNKMSDYYRTEVNRKSRFIAPTIDELEGLLDPSASPEEQLSLIELRESMGKCLDLLPAEYRRLLHLKYYEQLSSAQICSQTGLTPRRLEGKLYRARHALAEVVTSLYPHLKP